MLVAPLAGEVGQAEVGGEERGVVVDRGRQTLVRLRLRCGGELDQGADALWEWQAGGGSGR
ncbi:hypothetical protein [Streptomyces sp. NPDC013457]|uniref:hypothetical protein n=1 Tax=Streptomyces sp. NPDC013457 TaxID=3364866 RepID=UPI0036F6CACB